MQKKALKRGKRALLLALTCAILLPVFVFETSVSVVNAADSGSSIEGLLIAVNDATSYTIGTNSVYAKGENTDRKNKKVYTINFTNTTSYSATLSFDFTYSARSYGALTGSDNGADSASETSIGQTNLTGYSVVIASQATFTITCTVSTAAKILGIGYNKRQEITLSNLKFELVPVSVSAVSNNSEKGGAVASASSVAPETAVTFTATPSATYNPKQRFAYWEVVTGAALTDEQKTQNPLTLTITQATTLKAYFEEAPADISLGITILNDAGGTVAVGNVATLSTSGIVPVTAESGELILTATPKEGYAFAGWVSGTVTEISAALTDSALQTSETLTLDIGIDNQYWTAVFLKENTYSATVRTGDHGAATVGGSNQVTGVLLNDIVFVATPDTGYVFDGWYDADGNLVSESARYTHTVVENGDVSLEARFRNPRVYVSLGTGVTGITAIDVNGNTYEYTNFAFEVPAGTELTMTVSYDATNYGGIYGWYNNETAAIISGTSGALTYTVTILAKDQSYTVFSKDASGNMVGVCQNINTGIIYGALHDAMSAAKSGETVKLIQPVALESDLIVPAGVTLLVPYSTDDTGTDQEVAAGSIGSAFKNSLTVKEGVTLTVNGTLMINAKQGNANTVYQGNISGAYGLVTLNGDMLVNGTLKARGLIKGTGRIQTSSGATVYQFVELTDWRGGSITLNIYGDMFPLNQFYLQNIQVEIEYVYGSALKAYYFVYAASTETKGVTTLIESGNTGLFKINYGGKVVMRYEQTRNGANVAKSIVDIYGNVEVLAFSLTVKAYSLMTVTVSTEKSVCPFSGAFDVNVMRGANFKVTQKFRFLPGVRITVCEGGTLEITSTGAMYLYDVSDYEMASGSGYCSGKYRRLPQSIGKSGQFATEAEDALLIVNGTLIVNGLLCTSAGAGDASSSIRTTSNAGVIIMNNVSASESSVKEYDADGASDGSGAVVPVPFEAARGRLVTSADGVWDTLTVAVYFSNGEAWYTHKTEFSQNGEVLEDLTVYGVGAYPNVDAIVNGDTASGCEFGTGYTCSHWKKDSVAAGSNTAPHTTLYVRTVSLKTADFNLQYRLDSYVWMNAIVTIPAYADGTVTLDNTYDGTIQLVDAGNGTYYLVRKVVAKEFTSEFKVTLSINGVKTAVLDLSFPTYAATATKHSELIQAMLNYGKAADDYFEHGSNFSASANIFPTTGGPENFREKQHGALNQYNNVQLKTTNASVSFANCLGLGIYFQTSDTLVLKDGDKIVQVGLLVGMDAKYLDTENPAELKTFDHAYDKAYILYDGAEYEFTNKPDYGANKIPLTNGVLTDCPNISNKTLICIDLTYDMYTKRMALRPYVVIQHADGSCTNLYGEQYLYGLEAYCASINAKGSASNQSKNLVYYAWNYATIAATTEFDK